VNPVSCKKGSLKADGLPGLAELSLPNQGRGPRGCAWQKAGLPAIERRRAWFIEGSKALLRDPDPVRGAPLGAPGSRGITLLNVLQDAAGIYSRTFARFSCNSF